jgi:hypothetical protein
MQTVICIFISELAEKLPGDLAMSTFSLKMRTSSANFGRFAHTRRSETVCDPVTLETNTDGILICWNRALILILTVSIE